MKILEVRFMNLNSLMGEWAIDFTEEEFLSSGIFAITGPTGSGKSTLLDALTLALYGQTPRLGKITKTSNAIMSRMSTECYAEVTFKSSEGSFRCRWSQHRARKKRGGNLVEAEHEICDAATGKIIESKKRDVLSVVEQKTGMDYGRFTRSILLAQGDFSAFLRAGANDRAPILEQITGTEIYSDISMEVHRIQREKEAALDVLEAETQGIQPLSREEEENLVSQIQEWEEEEKGLLLKQEQVVHSLTHLDRYNEDLKNRDMLLLEQKNILKEREGFRLEEKRLERADKASELSGLYEQLKALRRKIDEQILQRDEILGKLPDQESLLQKQEQQEKKSLKDLQTLEEESLHNKELWKKIRQLDQSLTDKKSQIAKESESCNQSALQLKSTEQEKENIQTVLEQGQEELSGLEKQRQSVEFDKESFENHISDMERAVEALDQNSERKILLDKQLREWDSRIALNKQKIRDKTKAYSSKEKDKEAGDKKITALQEDYLELLDGENLEKIREDYNSLVHSRAYLTRVESLEEERTRLKQGEPCPLCGSLEHPYRSEETPLVRELDISLEKLQDRLETAEKLDRELMENRHDSETLTESLNYIRREIQQEEEHLEELKSSRQDVVQELQDLLKKREEITARFKELVLPWENHIRNNADPAAALKQIHSLFQGWKEQNSRIEQEQLRLRDLKQKLDTLVMLEKERRGILLKKQQELQILHSDVQELQGERESLFGTSDPDTEEYEWDREFKKRTDNLASLREARQESVHLLSSMQQNLKKLSEQLEIHSPQGERLEKEFQQALAKGGFTHERDWLEALLAPEEREKLRLRKEQLESLSIALESRLADLEQRLVREKETVGTLPPREDLLLEKKSVEQELQANRSSQGGGLQRLKDHEQAMTLLKSRNSAIKELQTDLEMWNQLYELIGSADGKKFRNFAQGLTFDLVLAHANRQLASMTDRYILVRDRELPLELNVVDNWQAGEIRTAKNLSGGESFIVSLALALGLSAMAGSRVRVDSLFLDEGFGTLDEESLDTALEALSSLHQEGKVIGIISHVPALKERIGTRIKVVRKQGGRSILTGPGVQSL